jgi:nicotinamide mononucleotide adenylyltransferase
MVAYYVLMYKMDIRWRTIELLLKRWSHVITNFQSVQRVVASVDYTRYYSPHLSDQRYEVVHCQQHCTTKNQDFYQIFLQTLNFG